MTANMQKLGPSFQEKKASFSKKKYLDVSVHVLKYAFFIIN